MKNFKCGGKDELQQKERRPESFQEAQHPNERMSRREEEAKTPKVRTAPSYEGPSRGAGNVWGGQLVSAWHPSEEGDGEVVLGTSGGCRHRGGVLSQVPSDC